MKQPNPDTFCVAPWFQIRNGNNTSKKVCCHIDNKTRTDLDVWEHLNNDQNIRLKKNLHAGIKDSACTKCWQNEENNVISLRQKLNGALLHNKQDIKNSWIQSYFNHKNSWESNKLLMADIKIGNTCNYACIMCVPEDSSLIYNFWQKNKQNEFVQDVLDKDPKYLDRVKKYSYKNKKYHDYINKILDNKHIKIIKLLGGEPLLDKNLLHNLAKIDDNRKRKMTIWIVTNGSVDLNETVTQLGCFKQIYFVISLEGIGEVQEYARFGCDWKQLEKNITSFNSSDTRNLSIHHTLQATTVLNFIDLVKWCNIHNLSLSVGWVKNPDYLSLDVLPPIVKEEIITNLKNSKLHVRDDLLEEQETVDVNDILHRLKSSTFNLENYQKFLRYIKWYESNKPNLDLKKLYPQLFQSFRKLTNFDN